LPISRFIPPDPRPCPICDSIGPRTFLHRQRFYEGPLGDGYEVVVCNACGAGFADGIPSQAELDRYYAEQSKYTYAHADGTESPYDFKRFELIADQLEPHLPSKSARILDIGCATGGLLAVLKRRGFANVIGSDPSPACVEAARRLHGIEVRTAALAQHQDWTDRFDAILLVGVLEHVREVRAAGRVAADLLKPDGLLYCAQPDVEAFAECVNAPYQQFSMEHVNFFSRDSLARLMAAGGLVPRATWHWMVEWREGVTDSVLSGVYARGADRPTVRPSDCSTVIPSSDSPLSPPSNFKLTDFSISDCQFVANARNKISCRSPSSPPPNFKLSSFPPDSITKPALQRYLAASQVADAAISQKIEALVVSRQPILVWGAGALTRRLLASTRLADANIAAFVDSSSHLQGTQLAGRIILAPAQLAGRPEGILICSVTFEQEITRTIREQLNLPNRLITLSDNG